MLILGIRGKLILHDMIYAPFACPSLSSPPEMHPTLTPTPWVDRCRPAPILSLLPSPPTHGPIDLLTITLHPPMSRASFLGKALKGTGRANSSKSTIFLATVVFGGCVRHNRDPCNLCRIPGAERPRGIDTFARLCHRGNLVRLEEPESHFARVFFLAFLNSAARVL